MNNEDYIESDRGPYMIDYDSFIRERRNPLKEAEMKAQAERAYQEIKKLALHYDMQKTAATVEGF